MGKTEKKEIRTCEEYVVDRILEMDSKVAEMGQALMMSRQVFEKQDRILETVKHTIKKYVDFRTDKDGDHLISFSCVFEKFNKDDFDFLEHFLNDEKEEEEDDF